MKRIALVVLLVTTALSAEDRQLPTTHVARDRSYHVVHYKLNLALDEKAKTCVGEETVTFVPLRAHFDTLFLDAAEMKIGSVSAQGRRLAFQLQGESLSVALPKALGLNDTGMVSISYDLESPKKGMYFVKPDSGYPDKHWQIWTQGENLDNHYWFPCYDFPNDKATSEMTVTVNEKFTVVSNGKLLGIDRDKSSHRVTYHWFEGKPHSSYLISLIAGEYAELKDNWGKLPISNFVYEQDKNIGMISFSKTPKMIDFFSKKIGYDYPWEKFAQTVVQDFIFGGMENVSAVTLTDYTIHDRRAHLTESSDGLVAHELAHQWWGDLLTCRDWSHAWLNEGFASYFDILFQEYDKGHDEASKMIVDAQQALVVSDVGEKRRPTVYNRYVNPIELFDNHIYGKGACVLHMLRMILGDDVFWKSISHYAHKYAFQNVETNDFKIAVEEASGYNLHWFFDEWLYKAGYPDLKVSTVWSESTKTLRLNVKQTQPVDSLTGLFTLPVDVQVWVNGAPATHRITISVADETFNLPASSRPELTIFDKGSWILKRVEFEKSPEEWRYQLRHASDGVDRISAINELRWNIDSSATFDDVARAMDADPFWEVRRSAVYALANTQISSAAARLVKAYTDDDARVRVAVVTSLGGYKGDEVMKTLNTAMHNDSSYLVQAAALTSLARVDSVKIRQYCTAGLRENSYHEVVRSAALRALSRLGDEEALDTIKAYTKYGVDRSIRLECLGMLGRVWKQRPDVLDYIITMLQDPMFQVRRAAIGILGNIGNKKAIEPLKRSAAMETDSRLVKLAQDTIEKIQRAHSSEN